MRREAVRARRWRVHGIGKVDRDVDIGTGELHGTVVVGGALAADQLRVTGALDARGPVRVAGGFVVRGSLDATTVRAGDARFNGPVRTTGELVVDGTLRARGTLRAPSVTCGRLQLRGSATVPGTLIATSVDAELVGDSSVGTVRCRDFRLYGAVPKIVARVLGREAVVTVDRVEAATAFVEGARVGFVHAGEIVLGRDAHVTAVEGRVTRAHPSSRVGPESWSRPPAGLSR